MALRDAARGLQTSRTMFTVSSEGRQEAESCTYHVTLSRHGFLAYCREANIGREADSVAVAISALRAAIEASHGKA